VVGFSGNGRRARLALAALSVTCLLCVFIPIAFGGDSTPTWKLKSYYSRGMDRSFKADVYEEMPKVPRVLVFGGSRSLRMDPATIKHETGLTAFNFGFHNGRPEDAWAVTDWAIDSHPDKPPTVIWCLQATTLADVPMSPGLIVDERLAQAFPTSLIKAKLSWAMKQPKRNILSGRKFGRDGMLWWNGYDTKRRNGLSLDQSLNGYLDPQMLAKAGNGQVPHHTRAMAYFVRTIRLLNAYHIKPLIVIMPYHPRALSAFLSVGWGVKQVWLEGYLAKLSKYLDFKVIDCLKISKFGGTANGFYDGSHLTAENSRRLLRYCIAHAKAFFKLPKPPPSPSPSPSPSASPEPSPSASPEPSPSPSPEPSPPPSLVPAPDYTPVPEDTSAPADFLE
jgi:hypothetical protein